MRRFPQRSVSGHSLSFDALYRRIQPQLVRYLDRLTGDADAAEDIAQEAFIRLLRQPELPENEARLWLFTVATNLVRDRGRMASRRRRLLADGPVPRPSSPDRPDEALERGEDVQRVRAALDQLNERDRQMLLMRQEGFQYSEIATAVQVAPGSVGTLIARALKRFATAYGPDEVTDDARG